MRQHKALGQKLIKFYDQQKHRSWCYIPDQKKIEEIKGLAINPLGKEGNLPYWQIKLMLMQPNRNPSINSSR